MHPAKARRHLPNMRDSNQETKMATRDERREEQNASLRGALGLLAVVAFAAAIFCLVLFVVLA